MQKRFSSKDYIDLTKLKAKDSRVHDSQEFPMTDEEVSFNRNVKTPKTGKAP